MTVHYQRDNSDRAYIAAFKQCCVCGYNIGLALDRHHPSARSPNTLFLCRNCHAIIEQYLRHKQAFRVYMENMSQANVVKVNHIIELYESKVKLWQDAGRLPKALGKNIPTLKRHTLTRAAGVSIVSLVSDHRLKNRPVKRIELVKVLGEMGIGKFAIDNALRQLLNMGILIQPKYGFYSGVKDSLP